MKSLAHFAIVALLAVAYFASPTCAVQFTWEGGESSNDWTDGLNWVGDVAPSFVAAGTNTDDLVFGNTANTNVLLGNNETEQSVRSIVFDADAPAYIFGNSLNAAANINLQGSATEAPASRLQNLSSNLQSFNTLSTITEYAMKITSSTTVDGGTAGFEFGGDVRLVGNATFNGSLGGDITIHGSVQGPGNRSASKTGANTLFLTGPPTASALNTLKDVRILIGRANASTSGEAGIVRIDNDNSLQNPGSDSSGYTIIYGRNDGTDVDSWNGRLELTNNITVGEFLSIAGRDGINAQAPSLWNFSGNNTLTGELEFFGVGPNLNFGSANGKLTFNNSIIKANNGVGDPGTWDVDHVLNWTGAGDGEFVPGLTNTFATAKMSLNVAGSGAGKLTLSGFNTYSGSTTVASGTLELKSLFGNSTIANSSIIHIDSDGTLDATAFDAFGGFFVGDSATQTIKGDGAILGDVRIAANSILEVDYGSSGIDSLLIDGAFDILNATVDFNNLGGFLSAGTHVFAEYDALVGGMFASVLNKPEGFEIVYNHGANSNQLALVGAPLILPGDFNLDGDVNAADYVVWRDSMSDQPNKYNEWRANFGASNGEGTAVGAAAVPEPATWGLLVMVFSAIAGNAVRSRKR